MSKRPGIRLITVCAGIAGATLAAAAPASAEGLAGAPAIGGPVMSSLNTDGATKGGNPASSLPVAGGLLGGLPTGGLPIGG
ncbi:hypothetical protein [Streptomyces sp. NPDC047886]|uniref:hypothetical protein n=1 Tax=Streptomyces sp. NPDC047886 TaxID=3365490 RepID=UPI003723701B